MKALAGIVLCAALAAIGQPAMGQTCPVNSVSAGDTCPGVTSSNCGSFPATCPAGATTVGGGGSATVIQNAIDAAQPGAVICVNPGVYTGTIDFKGKSVTVMSPTALSATLDGGGTGPVVTFASGEGNGSVLSGFKITGGSAALGGGILISNASPTIRNCLVTNNIATGYAYSRGGGAWIAGKWSAPTIRCTKFQGNQASYKGGGLESDYSADPYLFFDTFQGNTAPYGGGFGAGYNGSARIVNSEFLANSAGDGGGLHVLSQFGNTMVRRTVIVGNTASGSGGGAWVAAGFATVLNSVFDGNSASHGAAVAAGFGSTATVESSILVNTPAGTDATLAVSGGDFAVGTTLLSSYNLFFGNQGLNSAGTTLNSQNLAVPVAFVGCYCLPSGSPAIGSGMPDYHFNNDYNSQRNDIGAHGGPTAIP